MNTLSDLGEFGLIERLSRMLPATPNVLESIGDDCAVLRVFDHVLLLSSDLCIEGVHFRRDLMHPEEIGWKAAAAAISDIAAMGGAPMFSLVSLACPSDTEVTLCEGLYQGLTNVFSRYGGVIAGGDISRTHGPLTLDIAVIGEARQNKCLRRKGALPGDVLAITGLPGLSAGGLHALEHGNRDPDLTQRHCWPRPRIREGQWLCDRSEIHAMLDTSDGLVQDAGHLCSAGGVGLNIDPERLPIAPVLADYCGEHGLDPLELALTGGEDYELAFAMDADSQEQTITEFHKEFRTLVTVVGTFTDAWMDVRVAGEPRASGGFDHFRDNGDMASL